MNEKKIIGQEQKAQQQLLEDIAKRVRNMKWRILRQHVNDDELDKLILKYRKFEVPDK